MLRLKQRPIKRSRPAAAATILPPRTITKYKKAKPVFTLGRTIVDTELELVELVLLDEHTVTATLREPSIHRSRALLKSNHFVVRCTRTDGSESLHSVRSDYLSSELRQDDHDNWEFETTLRWSRISMYSADEPVFFGQSGELEWFVDAGCHGALQLYVATDKSYHDATGEDVTHEMTTDQQAALAQHIRNEPIALLYKSLD